MLKNTKIKNLKTEVLKILKNRNSHISGQELSDHLEVSRTAVWKVVHQLKDEGYMIEAVQNKGYRLLFSPNALTDTELECLLSSKWLGKEIIYKNQIDSTNILAKKLADQGIGHGTVVVADHQVEGKGRRGRNWESPSGTGIWMSIILRPNIHPRNASMLTLVMALSVCQAIEEVTSLRPQIKWPNDILLNNKKVCGILTEMSAEMTSVNHIVVGVGVNVNVKSFSPQLADMATSLEIEGKKEIKRVLLAGAIIKSFEEKYEVFTKHEDLRDLKEDYESKLINIGKEVRILQPSGDLIGQALGINQEGELLIKKADGEILAIYAGEVSVRGLYGYV